MAKKKKKMKKKPFIMLLMLIVIGGAIAYFINSLISKNKKIDMYLASDTNKVALYDENDAIVNNIVRGTKVSYFVNCDTDDKSKIIYDDKEYFVNKGSLVNDIKDTVLEKEMYVRTSYNINKSLNSVDLLSLLNKGDKVEITGFDKLDEDGNVNLYKVKNDNDEGYFYAKYMTKTKEEALVNYDYNGAYETHQKQKNVYGGGDGASLDYFPVVKETFDDNVMPEMVYSLYLNGTKAVINMIDDYIAFAKTTKINAFVVDIIDDVNIGYQSPYMEKNSPTSYKHAQNSLESYKDAIQKLKDNGFYVIGRITAFKDSYYVTDHNENAISDKNGKPLKHQSSYWPSAFNRDVWKYNVELAMEAVDLIGFNEIQFDYVRFPDGLNSLEKSNSVDYHNTYKETKAQAVQRFLMYAVNELHKKRVYVSADVFGESSYGSGYITSYGQYWPAISTVVDVISAMPYTDHFGKNYGGHSEPWLYPYDTISFWAKTASKGQKLSATPAIARTWITAYNTPVANSGTKKSYNAEEVESQIKALVDNGLDGGFMTWNAFSAKNNLEKYKLQKNAYTKEYRK